VTWPLKETCQGSFSAKERLAVASASFVTTLSSPFPPYVLDPDADADNDCVAVVWFDLWRWFAKLFGLVSVYEIATSAAEYMGLISSAVPSVAVVSHSNAGAIAATQHLHVRR